MVLFGHVFGCQPRFFCTAPGVSFGHRPLSPDFVCATSVLACLVIPLIQFVTKSSAFAFLIGALSMICQHSWNSLPANLIFRLSSSLSGLFRLGLHLIVPNQGAFSFVRALVICLPRIPSRTLTRGCLCICQIGAASGPGSGGALLLNTSLCLGPTRPDGASLATIVCFEFVVLGMSCLSAHGCWACLCVFLCEDLCFCPECVCSL